jgi:predicted nuclease of predicted toxin-antitoxin system
VKLLLDEHYSGAIADKLARRGHDVATVAGLGLQGAPDETVLEAATTGGRALLTNNARDFLPLATGWAAAGRDHCGLLLTSDSSMPRSRQTISLYVDSLARLMKANPRGRALENQILWLPG